VSPCPERLIHVSMLLPPHVLLMMPIGTPVDRRSSRAK